MGIVYKIKVGRGYIKTKQWHPVTSRHQAVKVLTRPHQQVFISLGLKLRR